MSSDFTKFTELTERYLDEELKPTNLDDPRIAATWDLICTRPLDNLYLLGTPHMEALAHHIQPRTLSQLTNLVALDRAGLVDTGVDIEYANAEESPTYCELTEDGQESQWLNAVLAKTRGFLLFSSQLYRLGTVVAGFSFTANESMRRAVGTKDIAALDALEDQFRVGTTVEHSDATTNTVYSPSFARGTGQRVWAFMKAGATYAVDESKAITRAQLVFKTAYLKANFPDVFARAVDADLTASLRGSSFAH